MSQSSTRIRSPVVTLSALLMLPAFACRLLSRVMCRTTRSSPHDAHSAAFSVVGESSSTLICTRETNGGTSSSQHATSVASSVSTGSL
ncbi:hypothetical protein DFJ73DRAFT_867234 [Zopfochytrium polystomum]|nr:hypothetical protein DFJ73DRAFT_867234 [Zopfochytrium polystomum]